MALRWACDWGQLCDQCSVWLWQLGDQCNGLWEMQSSMKQQSVWCKSQYDERATRFVTPWHFTVISNTFAYSQFKSNLKGNEKVVWLHYLKMCNVMDHILTTIFVMQFGIVTAYHFKIRNELFISKFKETNSHRFNVASDFGPLCTSQSRLIISRHHLDVRVCEGFVFGSCVLSVYIKHRFFRPSIIYPLPQPYNHIYVENQYVIFHGTRHNNHSH